MAPKKILAIKLRSFGDTVLMTAPLLELNKAYPQAEIHVLVYKSWAPLLEGFPGVRQVWTYERHSEKLGRARALARLALKLRKAKFDLVVNFHASPSSAVLSFSTGAQTRLNHFHGHKNKNRYSTLPIPGKGILKPIIERDMDVLRGLSLHIPAGRIPKVFLQKAEIREAGVVLSGLGLQKPILGLALGASRPTKSWSLARFADLALQWSRETQGGVLAIVGPGEEELAKTFLKLVDEQLTSSISDLEMRVQLRSRIQEVHSLSLRALAGILNSISILVGNDSGPRHLAVAVDTPTVTLFGPEDPFEWHPYSSERHPFTFIRNLPCRKDADPGMPAWCGLHTCTVEEHRCMQMIGVQSVFSMCKNLNQIQNQKITSEHQSASDPQPGGTPHGH